MHVFERVLLPVDFSEQSLMMIDCVSELRQFGSEEVIILHVGARGSKPTEEQERSVERIMKTLESQGFRTRFLMAEGDPVQVIAEAAEKEAVTLIAMASSGKGRAREFVLGSTCFGVVRRTPLPVLLNKFEVLEKEGKREVRPSCKHILETALVPIDLSICTEKMKEVLTQLSRRGLKNVVLLHVIESTKYGLKDDNRFEDVRGRMDALKKELHSEELVVASHIHYGTPLYNILEASREVRPSIIIIGRSGKSFLKGLALGSTSEEVIRKATVPLLVVPC